MIAPIVKQSQGIVFIAHSSLSAFGRYDRCTAVTTVPEICLARAPVGASVACDAVSMNVFVLSRANTDRSSAARLLTSDAGVSPEKSPAGAMPKDRHANNSWSASCRRPSSS